VAGSATCKPLTLPLLSLSTKYTLISKNNELKKIQHPETKKRRLITTIKQKSNAIFQARKAIAFGYLSIHLYNTGISSRIGGHSVSTQKKKLI